jgi:F0F1-type ATP synthase assembly protein I
MKKTAAHSATSINKTNTTQTISTLELGRSYFSTGWRIVTPVVLLVFIGAIGDTQLGSKPWLTLVGLVVGFMIASLLVKQQGSSTEASSKKR